MLSLTVLRYPGDCIHIIRSSSAAHRPTEPWRTIREQTATTWSSTSWNDVKHSGPIWSTNVFQERSNNQLGARLHYIIKWIKYANDVPAGRQWMAIVQVCILVFGWVGSTTYYRMWPIELMRFPWQFRATEALTSIEDLWWMCEATCDWSSVATVRNHCRDMDIAVGPTCTKWRFSKMEIPLFIMHFNGIFPYKPSIFGYFWISPLMESPQMIGQNHQHQHPFMLVEDRTPWRSDHQAQTSRCASVLSRQPGWAWGCTECTYT